MLPGKQWSNDVYQLQPMKIYQLSKTCPKWQNKKGAQF